MKLSWRHAVLAAALGVLHAGDGGLVAVPMAAPLVPAVVALPAPAATPSPPRPAEPARAAVPRRASGRYAVAPGRDDPPAAARGRGVRYLVEVERGLPFDAADFADAVHAVLTDPRGWPVRFRRVDRPPVDLRVSLSSPATARTRCLPLDVGLRLSCWQHGRAVINADRWATGAPTYGADVAAYRAYVVNHEVGHALGHDHGTCPENGRRAPVMVQQTKSLSGCRPNPWPRP